MKIDEKILVKNYKCFDSTGSGFESIFPINIIIGKNNSGKSSLIELIKFLIEGDKTFLTTVRGSSIPEVIIGHILTDHDISNGFGKGLSGGGLPGNHYEYGKQYIGDVYTYSLLKDKKKKFLNLDTDFVSDASSQIERIATGIRDVFNHEIFCNITAERDLIPENVSDRLSLLPNGTGATNYIQQIINQTNNDSQLIESELLKELNTIINPDIEFARILVQVDEKNYWEIFFEDTNNTRIALSKMGSGIKTILLVLLNLIVRPQIEKKEKNNYIFAFEELENNLHPSLQRRLYNYLKSYSKKNKTYFFLTTHSNIVIDAFGTDEHSQMIHVTNDGEKSTTSTVISFEKTKEVLKDLDIKASDLLQSNGIIWVEGPSDRIYLLKWLELISSELIEGLHFSIMFYGGRLLSNLSLDYDSFNKNVIPLLKINTNAFVLIDRDGKNINTKLNDTKKRIKEEIGDKSCWITKGREIENYLADETIKTWLEKEHGFITNFVNEVNTKLEDSISSQSKKIKLKYNLHKKVYSNEIKDFITKDSCATLDLFKQLENLVSRIKEWNSM